MSENSKLSLVLYEDQARPRYYELSRSSVRILLYGLPLITLISVCAIAAMAFYFKEIRAQAMRKEPQIIQSLKEENQLLLQTKDELIATAQELELKLATTDIDTEGLGATLGLFKFTPGMQDLSASPVLSIEEVELRKDSQSLVLNFNLTNLTPETTRQVGYIFAVLISGRTISLYPEEAFSEDDPLITFNKGEYFAVSRFRPVEASFPLGVHQDRGLVKILLFSRTGDLLAKKTQNYSL